MKGDTHAIQESNHFLIDEHIIKHGDKKIFEFVFIPGYPILIFMYYSLELAKLWQVGFA